MTPACSRIAAVIGLAAVAGVHAPQSGRAVQNLTPVGRGVVHILRGDEHSRRALEGAVRGEGHPQLFERRERRLRCGVGVRSDGS